MKKLRKIVDHPTTFVVVIMVAIVGVCLVIINNEIHEPISESQITEYIHGVEKTANPVDDKIFRQFLKSHPNPTWFEFQDIKTEIEDSIEKWEIQSFLNK